MKIGSTQSAVLILGGCFGELTVWDEIEIIIAFTYCFLLWGSPKPTTFDKRRVY